MKIESKHGSSKPAYAAVATMLAATTLVSGCGLQYAGGLTETTPYSSEVELDGDKLRATSYNLQFVVEVTDADGEIGYGWSMMAEKERTADYADYVSFGILAYNDDSFLGFSTKKYEDYGKISHWTRD